MPRPSHHPRFDHTKMFGTECKLWNSSTRKFPCSLVISSHSGPDCPHHPVLKHLDSCHSLNVRVHTHTK
jgi:hypothetical protein